MYGETKPISFAAFRKQLQDVDEAKPAMRLEIKKQMMHRLHEDLSKAHPSVVLDFGKELEQEIKRYDASDSLERAHAENRVVFRSWHKAGAIAEATPEVEKGPFARTHVGFDALNVSLDPDAFMAHKDAYRTGEKDKFPIIEMPSTMLHRDDERPTVFATENGTFTALQPEEHYAAFSAFNAVAKEMKGREAFTSVAGGGAEDTSVRSVVDALARHAQMMRASVTRPVLYNSEDLGTYTQTVADPDSPKMLHVRKGYTDEIEKPQLHLSYAKKMDDPIRANAVFYQSFNESAPVYKDARATSYNEMAVKFRSTGHTTPVATLPVVDSRSARKDGGKRREPSMIDLVPALEGRPSLQIFPSPGPEAPPRKSTPAGQILTPPRR